MDKIEIDEYVRTTDGKIDKVIIEYKGKCNNSNCNCKHISCKNNYYDEKDIVKHSKNIIELIEVGDILEIKEDGVIAFVGLEKDTTTITYQEIIDEIKNETAELLSILTKQQYEQNCYVVEKE